MGYNHARVFCLLDSLVDTLMHQEVNLRRHAGFGSMNLDDVGENMLCGDVCALVVDREPLRRIFTALARWLLFRRVSTLPSSLFWVPPQQESQMPRLSYYGVLRTKCGMVRVGSKKYHAGAEACGTYVNQPIARPML